MPARMVSSLDFGRCSGITSFAFRFRPAGGDVVFEVFKSTMLLEKL